jgi:tetratricopeptide (TPR) repeat protein
LGIRAEAAGALAAYWPEWNPLQREQLTPALNEYMNVQLFNADRGFGRTNLGNVYRAQGEFEKAEEAYLGAINVEPYFVNSYVNLADLYRVQGDEMKGLTLMQQGIKAQPKSGALRYSAGLSLLRLGKKTDASNYFKQATDTEAQNAQYWYVYGLSLEGIDTNKGAVALEKAFSLSGNPQHLFARCDQLLKAKSPQAKQCITQLEQYAPKNVIADLKKRLY